MPQCTMRRKGFGPRADKKRSQWGLVRGLLPFSGARKGVTEGDEEVVANGGERSKWALARALRVGTGAFSGAKKGLDMPGSPEMDAEELMANAKRKAEAARTKARAQQVC